MSIETHGFSRSARPALAPVAAFALSLVLLFAQTVMAHARAAPESFADLVEQVSDAVVNITTTTTVAAPAMPPMPRFNFPEGSPFEDLFRDFMDRQNGGPRRSSALGSGFVISEDGYIVTNNHVIETADEITIEFFNGDELSATVIGTDPNTDIAVLKVEADKPLKFVSFGDSDAARVGDWVMAVGNPLGHGFSVSTGIISARKRALSGAYDDYIQTDAAINRGNSGGPLFNMGGEVIGVNTAIISPTGGSIGIGFAMASAVASGVVDQLRDYGETRRGWLGVHIQDISEDMLETLQLSEVKGALVSDVPKGPAQDAGMLVGDVILTFDGQDVKDTRGLVRMVGSTPVGKEVRVVVARGGRTKTLMITLGRREEAEGIVPASVRADGPVEVMGLTLVPITDELRAELDVPEETQGVVIRRIDEASSAYDKGLRTGDVIVEAGNAPIVTVRDLEKQIEAAKEAGRGSLLLLVRRAAGPRFVALSLEG